MVFSSNVSAEIGSIVVNQQPQPPSVDISAEGSRFWINLEAGSDYITKYAFDIGELIEISPLPGSDGMRRMMGRQARRYLTGWVVLYLVRDQVMIPHTVRV